MSDEYFMERDRLLKFKEIVSPVLGSVNSHIWCARNGVDIVPEEKDLSPTETFCMGFRVWERLYGPASTREGVVRVIREGLVETNTEADDFVDEKFVDFLVMLAGRVPVNSSEGLGEVADHIFLFPRDLYEKILILGVAPP